jgi:integrase/recombinase XerD
VDRYLRVRAKHALAARPELWLGISGRGPVTPDGIYQIVAKVGKKAGVALYPHRFGITSATPGWTAEVPGEI